MFVKSEKAKLRENLKEAIVARQKAKESRDALEPYSPSLNEAQAHFMRTTIALDNAIADVQMYLKDTGMPSELNLAAAMQLMLVLEDEIRVEAN